VVSFQYNFLRLDFANLLKALKIQTYTETLMNSLDPNYDMIVTCTVVIRSALHVKGICFLSWQGQQQFWLFDYST
jgi:hypothetical protein